MELRYFLVAVIAAVLSALFFYHKVGTLAIYCRNRRVHRVHPIPIHFLNAKAVRELKDKVDQFKHTAYEQYNIRHDYKKQQKP